MAGRRLGPGVARRRGLGGEGMLVLAAGGHRTSPQWTVRSCSRLRRQAVVRAVLQQPAVGRLPISSVRSSGGSLQHGGAAAGT
ncbi:hypothetical protein ACP70R_012050 [Stipagrostis hirtigluma subsp. patula]